MLGWWLPFIPSLLALSGAIVALSFVTNKQREELQFRLTLALLLETYQDSPTIGRIAIEYLQAVRKSGKSSFYCSTKSSRVIYLLPLLSLAGRLGFLKENNSFRPFYIKKWQKSGVGFFGV